MLMASFDLTQAFYRLDRTLLEEVLQDRLQDQAIALRVVRKLDRVVYRLRQGAAVLELEAPLGIIVGDVLGPLLFVVYMDAFARDLQRERDGLRWPLKFLLEERTWDQVTTPGPDGGLLHSVHRRITTLLASDDDHDVFRPVEGWKQAREEIQLVRKYQRAWKMDVNAAKSSIMISWAGKGSVRKRRKAPRTMRLEDGEIIPMVRQQTHLGSIRTCTASLKPAVDQRSKKHPLHFAKEGTRQQVPLDLDSNEVLPILGLASALVWTGNIPTGTDAVETAREHPNVVSQRDHGDVEAQGG